MNALDERPITLLNSFERFDLKEWAHKMIVLR